MIDDIVTLMAALGDMSNLAMYVLGGFLFYKLALVGSVVGLVRLAIVKVHSILSNRSGSLDALCYTAAVRSNLYTLLKRDCTDFHGDLMPNNVTQLENLLKADKSSKADG